MANNQSQYKLAIQIAGQVAGSYTNAINQAQMKMNALSNFAIRAAKIAAAAWAGVKIGNFIGDAVNVYQDFEQAMANTGALAGATGKEFAQMREIALKMGASTTKTATEAAQALGYMALAGWDVETSMKALEPVLRLSEATGMDLARCSDLVTDSMSALGKPVKDLLPFLDKVTVLNKSANTSAEQVLEAFKGIGGIASSVGINFAELSTAMGVLANNGIKGAEAGTAMRSMLVNLTSKTQSSDELSKKMEKLGISVFDAKGKFRGLENVLLDLAKATEKMSDAKKSDFLALLFGKEYVSDAIKLLQSFNVAEGESLSEFAKLKEKVTHGGGALVDQVAKMTDTIQAAKAKVSSQWADMKIRLFEPFAGLAKYALVRLSEIIPKFTKWLRPKLVHLKYFIVNKILPVIDTVWAKVKAFWNLLQPVFTKIKSAIVQVGGILQDLWADFAPIIMPLVDLGATLFATMADKLMEFVNFLLEHKGLIEWLLKAFVIYKGLTFFNTAISGLKGLIDNAGLLKTVLGGLMNLGWLGWIATAAGLIWELYENCEWFHDRVKLLVDKFAEWIKLIQEFFGLTKEAQNPNLKPGVESAATVAGQTWARKQEAAGAPASIVPELDIYNAGGFGHYATGGIITRPTFAEIGEGGEPEAVFPLSKLQNFLSGGVANLFSNAVNLNSAANLPGNFVRPQVEAGLSMAKMSGLLNSALGRIKNAAADFNLPEIFKTDTPESPWEHWADFFSELVPGQNSGDEYQINYAPVININGNADRAQVVEAAKISQREFEKYMTGWMREHSRKDF